MAAAEHGASFPMARKLRQSMSQQQLHDFASGPMTGKPAHVPDVESHGAMKTATQHPHKNLGKFLHPPKAR